ncbi:asparagine synthase (glutamine-hydrolyzing) [Flavobacteriaceae bacterium M23B6Z8]
MCGFLAEYVFYNGKESKKETFSHLLEMSVLRGPDHTSILREQGLTLGFNRLAIQDLSPAGNQPGKSPSGRYTVTFNGEIYNFKELAETCDLQQLRSGSDTEVLLHLLDKKGVEKTVQLLNGMFAVFVWDSEKDLAYIFRDFAGIKPLYFARCDQGLIAASQMNQVYKHPWFSNSLRLRKETVREYMGFGFVLAPNTIFERIYQVCPGQLIKIDRTGKIVEKKYLEFPPSFQKGALHDGEKRSVDRFNELFTQVINRQLISDVPVSTFLSGGIDSPLVTAHAAKLMPEVNAFSFAVDHHEYDESEEAIKYARHLDIHQLVSKASIEDLQTSIDTHFAAYSAPLGDYSSIPTYLVCARAAEASRVILSGDGGDELFYGYPRMHDVFAHRNWFKIPFQLRKIIYPLFLKLGWVQTAGPRYHRTIGDWVRSKQMYVFERQLDEWIPQSDFTNEVKKLYKNKITKGYRLKDWLRWNEFYGHMQRVLHKVDSASMAHSIEVRVPFLDKDVINFSNPMNFAFGINKTTPKRLLKKAMLKFYPEELIYKKKKGFSVPIEEWLRSDLKPDLEKMIFKTDIYGEGIIDAVAIRKFVRDFLAGSHHQAWGVWHVYAWQKWAYYHLGHGQKAKNNE